MTSPAMKRAVRVLVVDDDELVLKLVARGLEEAGFDVSHAADAFHAMDYLERCANDCAVVVTDLVMPGKTGAQLAREACNRWPHLRVLYMTGYTRGELARHGVPDCPHSVLQKPFDMDDLCHQIRLLLAA
jgi:DNA-binding NtrC family response regulator